MNKAKKYQLFFAGTKYECNSKPELNVLLRKFTSGIGIIYPHSISFCIKVIKG